MIEGCRLVLPTGEQVHAISYRGDIVGWREQVARGAQGMGVPIGEIVGGELVLSDGRRFALSQCEVVFE